MFDIATLELQEAKHELNIAGGLRLSVGSGYEANCPNYVKHYLLQTRSLRPDDNIIMENIFDLIVAVCRDCSSGIYIRSISIQFSQSMQLTFVSQENLLALGPSVLKEISM